MSVGAGNGDGHGGEETVQGGERVRVVFSQHLYWICDF